MFNGRIRELNMTNGSLFKKLLIFALPLMLTGVLQLLYNAADVIVVGRYAGSVSLAAVGSTTSLINLLITLFMGFANGVNVNIAKYYGAHNEKGISDTLHTALLLALICGTVMGTAGFFAAKPLLRLMSSPDSVIDLSTLYLRIYFTGLPGLIVYNFGAAALRAAGDTNRPLLFLGISGILNIVLNLFFVIVLKMNVAGVALATTISQYTSTAMIITCFLRTNTFLKLKLSKLRINAKSLANIVRVGLPAGLQGVLFSISNVIIQSTVNSFGEVVMAGNSASISIEGFSLTCMDSMGQSAMTATGQNMGAGKLENINRILGISLLYAAATGIVWGLVYILFGDKLLSIYTPGDAEVIAIGKIRLDIFAYTYFTWGMMNVFVCILRGMGYSIVPTIISIAGICVFRIVWIYTAFALYPTLFCLYVSYPISWVISLAAIAVCYIIIKKRVVRRAARTLKNAEV